MTATQTFEQMRADLGVERAMNAYFAAHGLLPDDTKLIPLYHEALGLPNLDTDVEFYVKNTFSRP